MNNTPQIDTRRRGRPAGSKNKPRERPWPVKVETALTQGDDTLFPAGLTVFKNLGQPGQYAANEKVDVVGPKGTIENVRVLGPARGESQLELSNSDLRVLGLKADGRKQSGDLKGLPTVHVANGWSGTRVKYMVAQAHVHMNPADAGTYWTDGQKGTLYVNGGAIDVIVRINEAFNTGRIKPMPLSLNH